MSSMSSRLFPRQPLTRSSIASRHQAADILRSVAEDGQFGYYPQDVSPEQLGQADFKRRCGLE